MNLVAVVASARGRERRAVARVAAPALLVATLVVAPLAGPWGVPWLPAARAAAGCTGWSSDTLPPTTIRVLRTVGPAPGTVAALPFHDYVTVVMAAEWGSGTPGEALKAGAVAVKQYAWYRAMFWRGGTAPDASCYDVVDSSVDQVFAPESRVPSPAHVAAVDATWGLSIHRTSGLFATHYDAGANVPCGTNANGWQLLQLSAVQCARDGLTAEAILDTYYGPGLQFMGGVPSPGTAMALAFRAQPAAGSVGVPFSVQPVVAIVDAAGQAVTAGTSSDAVVSLALEALSTGVSLSCTGGLSRAAVAGTAPFDGCQLSGAADGAVIVATADLLAPARTAPFTIAPAAPVDVVPTPRLMLAAVSTVTSRGTEVRLAVDLAPPGNEPAARRTVHLQRSLDGVGWTSVVDLATDAMGRADVLDRPTVNASYRAVFDGAADLSPVTSPAVNVSVARVALLRPDNRGTLRRVSRGTAVTFAVSVRPIQPPAARGRVEYRLMQLVGHAWVLMRSWTVAPDAAGWARSRLTFSSRGTFSVRARALATATNTGSAWSPGQRYEVR